MAIAATTKLWQEATLGEKWKSCSVVACCTVVVTKVFFWVRFQDQWIKQNRSNGCNDIIYIYICGFSRNMTGSEVASVDRHGCIEVQSCETQREKKTGPKTETGSEEEAKWQAQLGVLEQEKTNTCHGQCQKETGLTPEEIIRKAKTRKGWQDPGGATCYPDRK